VAPSQPFSKNIVGEVTHWNFRRARKFFLKANARTPCISFDRARSRSLWRRFAARTRCWPAWPRDFFGEGCLVGGTSVRTGTAATLEPSTIYRIGKRAMLQAFHAEPQFAETVSDCCVSPQRQPGRRPLRSDFQPQRKAACPGPSETFSFRPAR